MSTGCDEGRVSVVLLLNVQLSRVFTEEVIQLMDVSFICCLTGGLRRRRRRRRRRREEELEEEEKGEGVASSCCLRDTVSLRLSPW